MSDADPFAAALAEKTKAQASSPFDEALSKKTKGYQYSVLPLSEDEQGKVHFDPSAGVLGSLKRVFTAPGEAVSGELDPNSPEGLRRIREMALTLSPAPVAMRAGEMAIPGAAKAMRPGPAPEVPTAEALQAAGGAGYQVARELGVDFRPRAVNALGDFAEQHLNDRGLIPVTAPKAHGIIDMLTERQPEGAVAPFTGLHAARKALSRLSQERGPDFRPTPDAAAATAVLRIVDRFMENPPAEAVLAGPAAKAGELVKEANANYAAGLRSGKLQRVEGNAELSAESRHSGLNLDNLIRQQAKALLKDNAKALRGFSPEEIAAVRAVSKGNASRNTLRFVGNMFGGGGGLAVPILSGLGAASGALTGGLPGSTAGAAIGAIVPPVIGNIARRAANRKAEAALQAANELVRKRSPLYEQAVRDTPQQAVSPTPQMLLMRALGLTVPSMTGESVEAQ